MMQRLTQESNGHESKSGIVPSKTASTFLLANESLPVVRQVDMNFTDIIRAAREDIQKAMLEAKQAFQHCEAEVEIDGEVSVVCGRDQIAINIKTHGRMARDKGHGW